MTKLTDAEVIRAAVELAEGWGHDGDEIVAACWLFVPWHGEKKIDEIPQHWLDALAAQLVRQVDALPVCFVNCYPDRTVVERTSIDYEPVASHKGPDRTMNTLRAIVQSQVLR